MLRMGLCKRKEIWVPTWRGWVALAAATVLLTTTTLWSIYPFLAPNHPLGHGILVVEGWLPDYALEEARQIFEAHQYRWLVVTGVPIDQGIHLTQEKNYAQLGASTLKHLGAKPESIVTLACPDVARDRTFSTARQVRVWLDNQPGADAVDIITLGVHARRTWLLYRLALGRQYRVGIIPGHDDRYDPKRWWTTSSGFRVVTSELIAYCYAKFLFYPRGSNLPATGR